MAEVPRRMHSATRRHARRLSKGQRGRLQPISTDYFKEQQVIQIKRKKKKKKKQPTN